MSSSKHIKWLYAELPRLVADDIIPPESESRLHQYYGTPQELSKRTVLVLLFGTIGALLIGLGIILIIAHNWDNFNRTVRTVFAFAPLVATHIACLWVLFRARESRVWREAVATVNLCAVAATISLVSQIYHLGGDLDTFLLIWMLLTLPLIYIMNATLPALVYLFGITWWHWYYGVVQNGTPWAYWLLVAAVIPHLVMISSPDRYTPRAVLLQWFLGLSILLAPLSLFDDPVIDGWPMLIYAGLLTVFCLGSACRDRTDVSAFRRPFLWLGTTGAVLFMYILSFKEPWRELARHCTYDQAQPLAAAIYEFSLAGVVLLGAAGLAGWLLTRDRPVKLILGLLPVITAAGYISIAAGTPEVAVWCAALFNLYLLAYSIVIIVRGVRQDRLLVVNGGMIILATLIMTRFFDIDIAFLAKGVVFILLGIGFIITNIFIVTRRTRERSL